MLRLLVSLCLAAPAWALNAATPFERLVMPGELVRAHAKWENDCGQCHVRFKKGGQSDKCRACHRKIDADLRAGEGFHGRTPAAREQECRHCHSDHQGRDARIVLFDADTFDHARSDFPLEGVHRALPCGECHRQGESYREAPRRCDRCHQDDDWHMGRLGDCAACHTAAGWGAWRFDHARTDFSLRGAHAATACERCHANARYGDTPTDCIACHRLDDVHRGANGARCQDCHHETQWPRPLFDHDKDTDYPLEGRHHRVPCRQCHGDDVQAELARDCQACHREDDAHNGLFGERCGACHLPKSWLRTVFDHQRDTDYPLEGRHRRLACETCHRGPLDAELPRACFACHQEDDRHGGQQGRECQQCHRPDGWLRPVRFDHDLTAFPLLGLHRAVPCEACHLSAEFKDAPRKCATCHGADDARIHDGRLGQDCARCHNANDWAAWRFDHDRETDYPLTGGHRDLDCHACHDQAVEDEIHLSQECIACHEDDDAHGGAFGSRCDRCHVTRGWNEVETR